MIDSNVIMRRALRYALDGNNLNLNSFQTMDTYTRELFQDLVVSIADDMRYNQLKYFRPFEHQLNFFRTGKSQRRGVLAANRIGKTVSTCFETAMHLTGQYPDWWPESARRFDKPITAFVTGESWDQVARVLQDELIGTKDIKIRNQIGTGAIPGNVIVTDTMRAEGANVISIEIKHISGANSYLLFGNYTQEVRNLQGFKLDLVVFDEQPPDDIFSELVTRTATTNGMVLCSFTPLKGLNGLVSKFWHYEEGYEHIRVAWSDVPEYDLWGEPFFLKTVRRQLEKDFLPHERDARMKGIPVMGKGAVFQINNWPTYKSGDYDFANMPGLERIIALDLGLINDATVISLMYWHPKEQEAWLHTQIVVTGIEEANPSSYINHLMNPKVFGTPIMLPADASTQGRYTMSSQSIRELFEEYNLNVYAKAIMNPPDSQGRVTNHKSYGINIMRQMLELGTLHVHENCVAFLREAQSYYVDQNGRFSDPDDCIDSARYALLGCLQGLSEPYDGQTPQQRMAQYKEMYYDKKLIDQRRKPDWKRVME